MRATLVRAGHTSCYAVLPADGRINATPHLPRPECGVLYARSPVNAPCHHTFVDAPKTRYNGRAYGMDIRVEKEDDGTLSVYEASPFSEAFRFVKRGPADEIVSHYDVSGSMRGFFEG
jgi:hypothetical protein